MSFDGIGVEESVEGLPTAPVFYARFRRIASLSFVFKNDLGVSPGVIDVATRTITDIETIIFQNYSDTATVSWPFFPAPYGTGYQKWHPIVAPSSGHVYCDAPATTDEQVTFTRQSGGIPWEGSDLQTILLLGCTLQDYRWRGLTSGAVLNVEDSRITFAGIDDSAYEPTITAGTERYFGFHEASTDPNWTFRDHGISVRSGPSDGFARGEPPFPQWTHPIAAPDWYNLRTFAARRHVGAESDDTALQARCLGYANFPWVNLWEFNPSVPTTEWRIEDENTSPTPTWPTSVFTDGEELIFEAYKC